MESKDSLVPVVGIHYYRPPSPPIEEWEDDFKQIKDLGFEAVKMWLYWGWHERKPGEFDWSESDRFFEFADENGLLVVPNILLELPPSWLKIRHVLQTPQGPVTRAHFPSIYIPCFDDPHIRSAAERFIESVTDRYKDRSIVHWDVWNEPRSKGTCCCEASRKLYAQWLQRRYENIEDYNSFFGKCFDDWESVVFYIHGGGDYADEFNWRLWAAEQLADQVHWVARLVRKIDPNHPVMCHAGISSPAQSVRHDTCVDALMMEGLDLYGSSCDASWESQAYTADASHVRGLENQSQLTRVRIQLDWLRSLSPKNWVCELYADLYNAWETRKPDMLLWQFWQAISRGLGGVMLWQYKSERIGVESLGYGLVGLDGKPNDRSDAIAHAIHLIRGELGEFFNDYVFLEPTIGILYHERSHLLSEMEGYYNSRFASLNVKAFWALYETLRRNNIPVQLVPHQHLDAALPKLSTLFLPGHGYMDGDLAEKLTQFVENGGHLIGQAGVGFRQANTWVSGLIPSCGLNRSFGCVETARMLMQDPAWLLDETGCPIEQLNGYKINLACDGGEAVARFPDGEVALVTHAVGLGRTYYLGGFLGLDQPEAGRLLPLMHVNPPTDDLARLADIGLDAVAWRRDGNEDEAAKAYFIFNATDRAIQFNALSTARGQTTPLFGELVTEGSITILHPNSAALFW